MKVAYIALPILLSISGCNKSRNETPHTIKSPSGKYSIVEIGLLHEDPSETLGRQEGATIKPPTRNIILFNNHGTNLGGIETNMYMKSKCVIGWVPNEDVVLVVSEKGTKAYMVQDDKLLLLEHLKPGYHNYGLELFRNKYGHNGKQ